MFAKAPDKRLRRLIADIATGTPEDLDEILGGFDQLQAARIRQLVAEYLGDAPKEKSKPPETPVAVDPPAPEPEAPPSPPPWIDGVSPWMALRLQDAAEELVVTPLGLERAGARREAAEVFKLTDRTRSALKAAAYEVAARQESVGRMPKTLNKLLRPKRRLEAVS